MKKRKPKKRGRPPMPAGKARHGILPIRVRPEERSAFEAAAQRQGLALSAWVRATLKRAIGLTDS